VTEPYYRRDLALVHHLGFGFHAEACAPGVLALLEPVRGGTVLEVGCGSGILTRHLLGAGHRVIATDASPAMLDLARAEAPGAELRLLRLPDDPVPEVDAVVGVGHVLNYLPDADAARQALRALAGALRPGGVLALDVCEPRFGRLRSQAPPRALVQDDWAITTRFSTPAPDRFVREITTFVREGDGRWRRDDERHDNVLLPSPALLDELGAAGVDADVRSAFGAEQLPDGLVVLAGRRR
jgi:SAM-dependent methyltransferase